ncbi:xylose isomerase domain-containing protein [Methanolobus psychrophilus R15]|nr:xylose isomerase domain-containing protein [Methanolobus psychrophilus R15]
MILGASSFAGSFSQIASEVESIELYIPKMGLYSNAILRNDLLDKIIDELSTIDLYTSLHAPYFAASPTYPQDVLVDTGDMDDVAFRLIRESIEIAGRLGSRAVVLHPGRVNGNREKSFSSMVGNLRSLAQTAEEHGVMLGLENKEGTYQGNLCTGCAELIRAIEEVNSDNLCITFDIGHANLTCGGNMVKLREFAGAIAPYVVHVHVHDNRGIWLEHYDGDEHLAPGKGIIDYSVLNELTGYRGIYNMEVFSMEDVVKGRETILSAIRIP